LAPGSTAAGTVKMHLQNILCKPGASDRTHAALAIRRGIIISIAKTYLGAGSFQSAPHPICGRSSLHLGRILRQAALESIIAIRPFTPPARGFDHRAATSVIGNP
jgi:hypothetical protein